MTRSSSTERWRRWRDRQATGEIVVSMPVDFALIAALLDAGLIGERESEDRAALARVIRRLASEALANALAASMKR